ncbi:amino acid adenylation domain-containing protein [Streptomyces sp. V4I23]|uniref:non-ribosomal peptide synthetase n=1 Tax=Streptomyces sp. V4I23 TaxID=3042282 RepID=UPI0027808193|nr:amino acid adenylation domain-containing protein [Streptomyces sp. V4I23]MDQ1007334.1 amino acid adenylation domain-containing protein [Streptomyces sp. V4I23]
MASAVTYGPASGHDTPSAGGFTALPRWVTTPVPGTAEHTTALPGPLTAELRSRAEALRVPLTAVLLAAHVKVLAELSGDGVVRTGYLAPSGAWPLPCRLTVEPGPWRQVVVDAHRTEAQLLASRQVREDRGPWPEVVFAPAGGGPVVPEDGVLSVTVVRQDDGPISLRLRYRTDVLDAGCAARIGGYHLAALEQIAADPDAPHQRQSLLSAEELRFQIDKLAGPSRELPDRRFHELFEERVRRHPDAVAAVHRDRRWTYQELNVRANRLARGLLAVGLRPEDVVAVVTERDLNWMAGVLGVLKAGGAYLPIDPQYPPGRIATMLGRARCETVLTEPGSTTNLDRAVSSLPGTRRLLVPTLAESDTDGGDLGLDVAADRLAYVCFTSGSTGEPKGAMCEHAGMLNHLYAKIDDLGIGEGQVVAQTASQCFDISVWQLLSALLVGGRTLLVGQEAILDADRFLDTVSDGRVEVLQLVPSYLDVVLSALERSPRDLPDLKCVSVTGEALKRELVQRWFTAGPGTRLVNAYGLTETSDDTNHEVMDEVPADGRIPLGRPVNNVHIYVVDDNLSPVPLGAPGAIVFSGVCVGRGYINDPERTRSVYLADPHRPGRRLYRGGDFGRWLPDGKLEFLGRKDAQVKIRGFRIEIGEIENTLLRLPDVRDGAVVVTGPEGHDRQLVAFCTSPRPLAADDLRERLGELLPEYMVPAAFHQRESLPLTANGKIDKKALTALAEELGATTDVFAAPRTPTEQRLAAAWSAVLGVAPERIGRRENFFDLGGTSLSAVRLAISLDRVISLRDLARCPVLSDLADLVDSRTGGRRRSATAVLRTLTVPDGPAAGALVCFPDTDRDAADFRPLADALRDSGLSVYAAATTASGAAPPIVLHLATEIDRLGAAGVLLWGDGVGATTAVETARMLEQRCVPVRRVFAAAPAGHPGLHDTVSPLATERLATPLTLLVRAGEPGAAEAAHAPETPDGAHGTRWPLGDRQLLVGRVDLWNVPGGGGHFLRTRPAEAAKAVVRAAMSPADT